MTHPKSDAVLDRLRQRFGDEVRRVEMWLYASAMARELGAPLRLSEMPEAPLLEQLLVWLDQWKSPCLPPEYALGEVTWVPRLGIVDRRHVVYEFAGEGPTPPYAELTMTVRMPHALASHLPVRLWVEPTCARHFTIERLDVDRFEIVELLQAPVRAQIFALGAPSPPLVSLTYVHPGHAVTMRVRNESDQGQSFLAWLICLADFSWNVREET